MTKTIKKVVVYGATGAQGGAVTRSLLQNPTEFSVRALTRNAESEKARELAKLGAEVVQGDGHKPEQMREALTGAWGFWLNTDHHDPAVEQADGNKDAELGRSLISIAAEQGVKVFMYSTTIAPSEFAGGKVDVPGMEEKNQVFKYACQPSFGFESVVGVMPGWYMENFLSPEYVGCFGGFPLQADAEGYLTFASPKWGGAGKIPFIAVKEDFGDQIHGLFLDHANWNQKILQSFSDDMTLDDVTQAFTELTGKKARYSPQNSPDDYPTYGYPVLEEIKDVFKFTQANDGNFLGKPNNVEDAKRLHDMARAATGRNPKKLLTIQDFFKIHYSKEA